VAPKLFQAFGGLLVQCDLGDGRQRRAPSAPLWAGAPPNNAPADKLTGSRLKQLSIGN